MIRIAGAAAVAFLLMSCIDLAVYGPYDDYSELGRDFISESVRRNLKAGEPFGDRAMAQDAHSRFASVGFSLPQIQSDLEAAGATCRRAGSQLTCTATRKWSVIVPRPTREISGELKIDRIEPQEAEITYSVATAADQDPLMEVEVRYRKVESPPGHPGR